MEEYGRTAPWNSRTVKQCGTRWKKVVEKWNNVEQCCRSATVWNSMVEQCDETVWNGMAEQWGGTVGWSSGTMWWNSETMWNIVVVVKQCGTVWSNGGVQQWNCGTMWKNVVE